MNTRSGRRRCEPSTRWALLFAAVLLLPATTAAQGATGSVCLNQYRFAETVEDGFAISRPGDLGNLRLSLQLHMDYAYNPLVFEAQLGDADSESFAIVEHMLTAQVGLALGLFDRLVIFAGLPVNFVMEGVEEGTARSRMVAGFATDSYPNLGDVSVGARFRIIGESHDAGAVALQLTATFPSAREAQRQQQWSGDQGVSLHPEVLAEFRPLGARITLNLGARFRTDEPGGAIVSASGRESLRVDHELTWGVGIDIPVVSEVFHVLLEGWGANRFADFGDRETSPIEVIAGVRIFPFEGVRVGLAGGLGIQRGYGSPDFRGVFTFGWATPEGEEEVPEPEAVPVEDSDGDGLMDDEDQCPQEPEDIDQFEDDNGCPDPDNDGDGVLDGPDECPLEAEDIDQFEDGNGCPDPDNDNDQIPDATDRCRDQPEDRDQFEDDDGCPDPDNDNDTVLDAEDRCPLDPGRAEEHGCPRAVRVNRETGQIVILQRVEFASNRDRILPASEAVLTEVRAVVVANAGVRVVRVEGHTDNRGRDARNMNLSQRRAAAVRRWLIQHGIAATRLHAWGCGEAHAVQDNGTRAGRQANRRVEFHIIDPAPQGGARNLEGCQDANEVEPRDGTATAEPSSRSRRRRRRRARRRRSAR